MLAFPCAEIVAADLAAELAHGDVVLFDVRTPAEQAVSRIAGAIAISPETTPTTWRQSYAATTTGRRVVFYCAVGLRSARLAAPLAHINLRGGIFHWSREGRALVNDAGPTRQVHPCDERWGRLLRND